jgi:hypothetical protein
MIGNGGNFYTVVVRRYKSLKYRMEVLSPTHCISTFNELLRNAQIIWFSGR